MDAPTHKACGKQIKADRKALFLGSKLLMLPRWKITAERGNEIEDTIRKEEGDREGQGCDYSIYLVPIWPRECFGNHHHPLANFLRYFEMNPRGFWLHLVGGICGPASLIPDVRLQSLFLPINWAWVPLLHADLYDCCYRFVESI